MNSRFGSNKPISNNLISDKRYINKSETVVIPARKEIYPPNLPMKQTKTLNSHSIPDAGPKVRFGNWNNSPWKQQTPLN